MASPGGLSGATIAFDLDGTLVDTAPDLIGALNVVLGEQGLPLMPLDAVRHLVGRGSRGLIERGFADAGAALDPAKAAGAPVVVVSFGYTETPAAELGADVLIHSFAELPQAAERLLVQRREFKTSVAGA